MMIILMNGKLKWTLTLVGVVASISAGATHNAWAKQEASEFSAPFLACSQLNGMSVAPGAIGLPTSGATVVSTEMVAASGTGAASLGAYCKVIGEIAPIDPSAPPIRFQIHLPSHWNQKTMMFGGGGFDGELGVFLNFVHAGPTNQLSPQGRGYAVFGSDAGHTQNQTFIFGRDASFAANAEALNNFASDALKKTRDSATAVVTAYYAKTPVKAYFHGGSSGGREGLTVAQKWPQDYDGVVAMYPDAAATGAFLQFGRITRALAAPGAYLNVAKRQRVLAVGMAACDGLDGVQDGVISNVAACNAIFNPPNNAPLSGVAASLRCQGGVDTGDTCLSDVQVSMLRTYNSPIQFGSPLAYGQTSYPGFNVWGVDLGLPSNKPELFLAQILGLNSVAPSYPIGIDAPYLSVFWDQWMKYFITNDANFDSFTVDPANLGPWTGRVATVSTLLDATNTDLSAFHAKGGKLLMLHGASDALIATQSTAQYYDGLVSSMGKGVVKQFVRYYEVPGYGHSISPVFNAGWDSISVLEDWIEDGKAPKNQVVEDKTGVPGRTRPLCEYPEWPRYKGGDVNLASSFKCTKGNDD